MYYWTLRQRNGASFGTCLGDGSAVILLWESMVKVGNCSNSLIRSLKLTDPETRARPCEKREVHESHCPLF